MLAESLKTRREMRMQQANFIRKLRSHLFERIEQLLYWSLEYIECNLRNIQKWKQYQKAARWNPTKWKRLLRRRTLDQ